MVHFLDVVEEIEEALDYCRSYGIIEDERCVVSRLAETLNISEEEAEELLWDWFDWKANILPARPSKTIQRSLISWVKRRESNGQV